MIAVGESKAAVSRGAVLPALSAKVIAFPSREVVAESAAPISQEKADKALPALFSSSPTSLQQEQSTTAPQRRLPDH